MYRKLELDDKIFNRCNDILVKVLQGGNQLTRDKINEEFKRHKIIAQGHRLSYIMMYAELEQIICSGARQGKQFTYALLDERVREKPAAVEKDEALAQLTARYFASRAPATIYDFSAWSGLSIAECKTGMETVKDELNRININDLEYCMFRSDALDDDEAAENMYLLPIYDEFIMGYRDRSAINLSANSAPFKCDGNVIIFNGQIIGTWKRTVTTKQIKVEYDFSGSITGAQKLLLNKAIARLSSFYNLPAV
jgi:hypothetical protein